MRGSVSSIQGSSRRDSSRRSLWGWRPPGSDRGEMMRKTAGPSAVRSDTTMNMSDHLTDTADNQSDVLQYPQCPLKIQEDQVWKDHPNFPKTRILCCYLYECVNAGENEIYLKFILSGDNEIYLNFKQLFLFTTNKPVLNLSIHFIFCKKILMPIIFHKIWLKIPCSKCYSGLRKEMYILWHY